MIDIPQGDPTVRRWFPGQRSGHRLLAIARPPIVFYGLYGMGERRRDAAAESSSWRSAAASPSCSIAISVATASETDESCQAMLDKLLYDTDRAIDPTRSAAIPRATASPNGGRPRTG